MLVVVYSRIVVVYMHVYTAEKVLKDVFVFVSMFASEFGGLFDDVSFLFLFLCTAVTTGLALALALPI